MNRLFRTLVSPLNLIVLFSLLCATVVLLVNIRLRDELRDLRDSLDNQAMAQAPAEGTHLRLLIGTDNYGRSVAIDPAALQVPVLAIVMSPSCRFCNAEIPTWKRLIQINRSAQLLFINLGGSDDSFLAPLHLPISTLRINIARPEAARHGFEVTPTTLLIEPGGRIRWSWAGRLTNAQRHDLENMLRQL